jgi:RimJ/RimL family protein N-acetyltransferase
MRRVTKVAMDRKASRTGAPHRAPDLRGVEPRGNETVLLRAWQADDLAVIAEASDDPYIPLITTVPAPFSAAAGNAWLRRQWDQAAEGRGCPMAIAARDTGAVVGMATINRIDWTHRRGEIGYWILRRHRGQGFARAAVALLPGLARDLGLVRVQALVEPGNHASQAVCRAAGFTEEGTLRSYHRIGDENRDMIMFARLLRPSGSGH